MNSERLNLIIEILDRLGNSLLKSGTIDFYKLFNISQRVSLSVVNDIADRMKLTVLFHPDQYKYIPLEYQESFSFVCSHLLDFFDVFSNEDKRSRYDRELSQFKDLGNSYNNPDQFPSSGNDQQHSQQGNGDDINSFDFYSNNPLLYKVDQIFTTSVQVNGFRQALFAMKEVITNDNYNLFTRTDKCRESAKNLGKHEIFKAIMASCGNSCTVLDYDALLMYYLSDYINRNEYGKFLKKTFVNACQLTYQNHGSNQARYAIEKVLFSGNPGALSNGEDKYREELNKYVKSDDYIYLVLSIMNKSRIEQPNYSYVNMRYNMGVNNQDLVNCNNISANNKAFLASEFLSYLSVMNYSNSMDNGYRR